MLPHRILLGLGINTTTVCNLGSSKGKNLPLRESAHILQQVGKRAYKHGMFLGNGQRER